MKILKKIGKKIIYFILFIFIIFEFYYYIDFGDHRKLTSGEVSFLKKVFNEKVDYKDIKIYSRKFLPNPIQSDNVAMAPNGNIYFPEKYFSKNFSKDNFYNQAWLVHEVAHVRQYEKENQLMAIKGTWLILKSLFIDFDPYYYEIYFNKDINAYNIEQQGEIARNYFLYLKGLKNFTEKEVKWYKSVLEDF